MIKYIRTIKNIKENISKLINRIGDAIMRTLSLSPAKLQSYLEKMYDYDVSVENCEIILTRCEVEYDLNFSEDELMSIVEEYL